MFRKTRPSLSPDERERLLDAFRKQDIIHRGTAPVDWWCFTDALDQPGALIIIKGRMARGGRYRVTCRGILRAVKYQDCYLVRKDDNHHYHIVKL